MNQDEYLSHFPNDKRDENNSKRVEAFKQAVDTRKFEIELYWKRATYFWAFIAVTFAGYGLALSKPEDERGVLVFLLSCFGFILSFAWFFANRGSKQWQENWEHHLDHLEDDITGPLYKITLHRQKTKGIMEWLGWLFTGPSGHSVSKINQLVSLYISGMWLILVYSSKKDWHVCQWPLVDMLVLVLTTLAAIGIAFGARTYPKGHFHNASLRESKIVEKQG